MSDFNDLLRDVMAEDEPLEDLSGLDDGALVARANDGDTSPSVLAELLNRLHLLEQADDEVLQAIRRMPALDPMRLPMDTPEDRKSWYIFSLADMREKFLRRFLAQSLNGFLRMVAKEWEAPVATRRWTPTNASKTDGFSSKETGPYDVFTLVARANDFMSAVEAAKALDEAATEAERAMENIKAEKSQVELLAAEELPVRQAALDKALAAEARANAAAHPTAEAVTAADAAVEGAKAHQTGADAAVEGLKKQLAEAEKRAAAAAHATAVAETRHPVAAREQAIKNAADAVAEARASLAAVEKPGLIAKAKELVAAEQKAVEAAYGAQMARFNAARKLYRYGVEADRRLDSMLEENRKNPMTQNALRADPITADRVPPTQQEFPKAKVGELLTNFLDDWLRYDPTKHVQAAAALEEKAPAARKAGLRDIHKAAEAEAEALREQARRALEADPVDKHRPRANAVALYDGDVDAVVPAEHRELYDAVMAHRGAGAALRAMLTDPDYCDAAAAIISEPATRAAFVNYLAPLADDSPARAALTVVPDDTLHRWEFYEAVNYEELRHVVNAFYPEKPGLEQALYVFDFMQGTQKEAEEWFAKFTKRAPKDLVAEPKLAQTGAFTMLAPWKQNRAKVDFYNQETEIVRRILERMEEDRKIGEKLMKDRVLKTKAKNIAEAGPDAKGLADYKGQSGGKGKEALTTTERKRAAKAGGDMKLYKELEEVERLEERLGALEKAGKLGELSADDRRELVELRESHARSVEMLDVPPDAIQFDGLTVANGKVQKKTIYTKAETEEEMAQRKAAMEEMVRGQRGD